jgi:hypothetical protein
MKDAWLHGGQVGGTHTVANSHECKIRDEIDIATK